MWPPAAFTIIIRSWAPRAMSRPRARHLHTRSAGGAKSKPPGVATLGHKLCEGRALRYAHLRVIVPEHLSDNTAERGEHRRLDTDMSKSSLSNADARIQVGVPEHLSDNTGERGERHILEMAQCLQLRYECVSVLERSYPEKTTWFEARD